MDKRRVVVVAYANTELLDVACVTSAFAMANLISERELYELRVVSPGAETISCDSGLQLLAHQSLESVRGPLDTLLITGGTGYEAAAADTRLVGHVRRLARESRRVASVCVGVSVLAAAGLLDGKRAATHWRYADQLAQTYEKVTIDPKPIFIREGNVATSAGVTSALDLTLAFIEEDLGAELARWVARALVTYLQRPGNQAQMSMFTAAPPPEHDVVRKVVSYIAGNLSSDLSASTLAAQAGVSERHLVRLFVAHLGLTLGKYVRQARIEAAAQLLASSDLPVARVATRCGFGSAETMRQAFVDRFGIPPSRFRATQVGVAG
ncbi:GlxA family transcriptional regulator [Tenggerimyces flavus]|uniref:GlxA family transcriptional regulator n=1 Tax=Tenggerimyces flavus TaxID=1708749 RepID=A0ABV7YPW3_9ACTN|nr:DJ-1/PfpI family protein [Tenggerimyces flavus]MBM7784942.1 transcriptional regulator GlxA family with amidase domain [Tenggerimyces flavus]